MSAIEPGHAYSVYIVRCTDESLYVGHPKVEGFEVILSERKSSAAA